MIEKLKEVKELIEAGKLEEAKALIDEVIADAEKVSGEISLMKDTIGGGGVSFPPIKK